MITQHTLKPNPGSRRKKRTLGRGDASGLGSYSTRGVKGQNARSGGGTKPGFEGGQTPLIRRLPKLKGFTNINRVSYQIVNVERLNVFDEGSTVDIVALFERNIISKKSNPLKVLGHGALLKKLTIKADAVSAEAQKKIEDKGGSIVLSKKRANKAEAAAHAGQAEAKA